MITVATPSRMYYWWRWAQPASAGLAEYDHSGQPEVGLESLSPGCLAAAARPGAAVAARLGARIMILVTVESGPGCYY